MHTLYFSITLFYFLIGAAGILRINQNDSTPQKRERWVKYLLYLFIVYSVILSIVFTGIKVISSIILIMGLIEIINVWKQLPIKPIQLLLLALLIYLPLCYYFIQYSFMHSKSEQLFVYLIVFTFDGFAQITGQLIGKHKPFPSISPNKTTEGIIGGVITSLVTAYLLKNNFSSTNKAIVCALFICLLSLLGDLTASYYKRNCRVKDFSNIIPGHGGFLDRFDSYITAGALYYFVAKIVM
jgi:phosphatidate cytidylyltransferase